MAFRSKIARIMAGTWMGFALAGLSVPNARAASHDVSSAGHGASEIRAASGEKEMGSVLVFVLESVSLDTLTLRIVNLTGAERGLGTVSSKRVWTRLQKLPSGDHELEVGSLFFETRRVPIRIRSGREDTVTVVLTPWAPVVPGHTFVTHPPRPLPERPADNEQYPLRGFSFAFSTKHGERVDTAAGLVTKDLVGNPDTTISLVLSPAELDRIRKRMIAIRFFDMTESPSSYWPGRSDGPDDLHLVATAGGITRRLDWPSGMIADLYPSDDWKRIRDLVALIREIVAARPEYRALPRPYGAYL